MAKTIVTLHVSGTDVHPTTAMAMLVLAKFPTSELVGFRTQEPNAAIVRIDLPHLETLLRWASDYPMRVEQIFEKDDIVTYQPMYYNTGTRWWVRVEDVMGALVSVYSSECQFTNSSYDARRSAWTANVLRSECILKRRISR